MRNADSTPCDRVGLRLAQQRETGADNARRHLGNQKSLQISEQEAKAAVQQEPAQ